MSGGHYDYKYWQIYEMSELIERDLMGEDMSQGMRQAMRKLAKQLKQISEKARALEWYMSGDITEENCLKDLRGKRS